MLLFFFFFNDTATTEIYTLSLHDALPISAHNEEDCVGEALRSVWSQSRKPDRVVVVADNCTDGTAGLARERSEEHTSELQSRQYLVCRLLLEKKKNN